MQLSFLLKGTVYRRCQLRNGHMDEGNVFLLLYTKLNTLDIKLTRGSKFRTVLFDECFGLCFFRGCAIGCVVRDPNEDNL